MGIGEQFEFMKTDNIYPEKHDINNEKLKQTQQTLMGLYNIPHSKEDIEMRLQVNRTHEECNDCQLEWVNPPQCKGHASGEVDCPEFKQKVIDKVELTSTPNGTGYFYGKWMTIERGSHQGRLYPKVTVKELDTNINYPLDE